MKKYLVTLTSEERERVKAVIQKGKNAAKLKRAYVLFGADASPEGQQMTDQEIVTTYGVSLRTVERVRQRLVEEGFDRALNGKPPYIPTEKKIDGDVEAHLIALACSQPPSGRVQWTLRLLAENMVDVGYIRAISHESVRQVLKKTN